MNHEIKSIREQMRSDFETTMLGLATERDATATALNRQKRSIRRLVKVVRRIGRAVDEQIEAIKAGADAQRALLQDYVNKTSERLDALAGVVEGPDSRLGRLESRVDALEKKQSA